MKNLLSMNMMNRLSMNMENLLIWRTKMRSRLRMNTGSSLNWDSGLYRAALVASIPAQVWGFSQCATEAQVVVKLIAVICPVPLVWAIYVAVKYIGHGFVVD